MGLHGAYQVPAMLRQGVGCADELLHGELEETAAARHKPSWSSQVHRGVHLPLNYFTGRGLLPGKADHALKASAKGP